MSLAKTLLLGLIVTLLALSYREVSDAAIDALTECAPYLAHHKDWSIAGTLTQLEQYNGLGHAPRDVPSPYLWAGTDQYKSGKFVRERHLQGCRRR